MKLNSRLAIWFLPRFLGLVWIPPAGRLGVEGKFGPNQRRANPVGFPLSPKSNFSFWQGRSFTACFSKQKGKRAACVTFCWKKLKAVKHLKLGVAILMEYTVHASLFCPIFAIYIRARCNQIIAFPIMDKVVMSRIISPIFNGVSLNLCTVMKHKDWHGPCCRLEKKQNIFIIYSFSFYNFLKLKTWNFQCITLS